MKLSRYNDFLLESLILESVVRYSNKFRGVLQSMRGTTTGETREIVDTLLEVEQSDYTVTNNYFDILDDKELLGYCIDRKAQDLLGKRFVKYTGRGGGILKISESNQTAFNALQFQPTGDRLYRPSEYEIGEIQASYTSKSTGSLRGTIYYKIKFGQNTTVISNGYIEDVQNSDAPFKNNRQSVRVGRGIRLLLGNIGKSFTDNGINLFVNAYKAEIEILNDVYSKFEIVEGEDIKHWYYVRNYESSNPTLGTSCMRHAECSDYFGIYVENKQAVKMVILKSDQEGKIKGRALIWQIETPVKTTFMDRVYYNNESDLNLFKEYAKKMGWAIRPTHDYNAPNVIIMPDGSRVSGEISTKVYSGSYEKYPYCDSLKFYNTSTGHLTSGDEQASNIKDSYIWLCSTSGGYSHWDDYDREWHEYED